MSFIEENWDVNLNMSEIEKNHYSFIEVEINSLTEHILKLLEDNFISHGINSRTSELRSNDEQLRLLIEGNKELRQEIEMKLKEFTKQQDQYENYKKDQKLLSQEIKDTHEAFLMAKKFYKKYLKIYFTIESRNNETQVIFVQFFTESKKDSDNYFVRLLRNLKSGKYDLQSVQPKLKNFKDLRKKLLETNDVPGILCYVRQAFLKIKGFKK